MKKNNIQKQKLFVLVMFCLFVLSCGTRTTTVDINNKEQVKKWYEAGEWLNGFQMKPHESINQQAFAKEYFSNKELWDKTFEWLKTVDFDTISPGRYVVEERNANVTVSDAPAPELGDVKWESHKKVNDVQLILRGRAQMAVVPISEAIVTEPYDERRDVAFYDAKEGKGEVYVAEPGMFLIFTPEDVHKAGAKFDVDTIKRLYIKVKAAEQE